MADALPNSVIAERLDAFAALLDLAGSSYYAVRAYRRAAETIRGTPAPVAELVRSGEARRLRGIGPGIATRLAELVETGTIAELEELERTVSPELVGFGRALGFSAQRMVAIGQELGIRTGEELRAAAAAGRLASVPGIGPKTEAAIRAALARRPAAASKALTVNRARALVGGIAAGIGGELAGDPRRYADESRRLAVVAAAADPEPVLDRFAALPEVVALVERAGRRAVGVTVEGIPVELVVAEPGRFGTELVRATGSEDYVAALGPLPDAPDEEGVFRALGLPWVPPELREAGSPSGHVPLDPADVRGDLHCHTTWSDGRASVLEMAVAARDRGYDYLAICDHTKAVRVVAGLDADDVRRQREEVEAANDELAPFRVLAGIECDVRPDGMLDLPDDVLAELEWVTASVHAGQRGSREALTARVLAAIEHPAVRAIGHPTGRIVNHRPHNAVDLERIAAAAAETGVALEVNGLPDRLDLKGEHVRLVLDLGARITTSTDAHSTGGLANMELAVATARRGGATAADVLNTLPLADLLAARR
jgi:DNA polymerase (family 10)